MLSYAVAAHATHQRESHEEESEARGYERHESGSVTGHHQRPPLTDTGWGSKRIYRFAHCSRRSVVTVAASPGSSGHSLNLCIFLFIAPAGLNEELVQLLLLRDELHVEQDAMLVDVEDLTRCVICRESNQSRITRIDSLKRIIS